ncbi:MAG: HAD hydrolase-like protein [Candidatus Kerfeldbacteria bacterium]|nr:HAD hydrolase-like protein [Candidatus Kerfeldbacteria bacterium]
MPTILIDLDYTLLDTQAFSTALGTSLGLSHTEWVQVYNQFVKDNGLFSARDFLRGVESDKSKQFYQVVKQIRRYLYSDTVEFLKQVEQKKYTCVLMTVGEDSWQKDKLTNLRLPAFIQTSIIQDRKANHLADYYEPGMLIVDDRAIELEPIAAQFPETHCYWITRSGGKYLAPAPQCAHTIIKSLNEIKL